MASERPLSEEPLVSDQRAFDIPVWFRWAASIVAFALIVLPTIVIVRYSITPERFVSPTDLGLTPLILAGAAILLAALAPWKALGLRIRKIGPLELEQVVTTQATEHAEEFTELRARIEELETKARRADEISPITEHLEDVELYPLLTKFLEEFRPTPFSPIRIRDWGSRQPGYEKLAHFKQGAIRRVLQKLVTEGKAATRLGRLGNTLYKVKD
jgi:hypothetical protein